MTGRTHFVYTAYDTEGRALYVGCTKDPDTRYRAHMSSCSGQSAYGWFGSFVTRWQVTGPLPKLAARQLERDRIAKLQPVFNGLSKGNRVRDAFGTYRPEMLIAYLARQASIAREEVAA